MRRQLKSYPPGCDLATMASEGRKLWCGCWKCGRRQIVDPATLIPKLGPGFRTANVYLVLKCSNCGAKGESGVWATPDWPDPQIEHARRMGIDVPPEADRSLPGRPVAR
jgi:hypothetical protein